MPLQILHGDLTQFACDAIVNPANKTLRSSGGGLDAAIRRAAGPDMEKACRALHGCRTGKAKLTDGFALPCRYVIHTVGPVFIDGRHREAAQLAACYRSCMQLAAEKGCKSIAFPLISAGANGYPKAAAMLTAVETLQALPETAQMEVFLLLGSGESPQTEAERRRQVLRHRLAELEREKEAQARQSFTQALPPLTQCPPPAAAAMPSAAFEPELQADMSEADSARPFAYGDAAPPAAGKRRAPKMKLQKETLSANAPASLDEALRHLDAGFAETLLQLIDARGMTDAECYKKAGIDRKLFSKIRSDPGYRPSKPTVLAFAFALELTEEETADLLRRAGYALSSSSVFDVIVTFYLRQGVYDLFEINETLFSFDQKLIGA